MRVVLIATGAAPGLAEMTHDVPAPMMPLMGKPFLQHQIELLAGQGIRLVDLVLHDHPDQIEEMLGDGTRWGCSFTYHVSRSATRCWDTLAMLAHADGSALLVVAGDALPAEGYGAAAETLRREDRSFRAALHRDVGGRASWIWGIVPSAVLAVPDAGDVPALDALAARAIREAEVVDEAAPVLWNSYAGMIDATKRVMDGGGPALLVAGRVQDERVWIGRNVSLHPTTHIEPPVFIGADCEIGERVRLGPYVAIEGNCVLDRGCSVRESLVCRSTYVGEELELDQAVVGFRMIANARHNVVVPVPDDFLLGSLRTERLLRLLAQGMGRLAGLAMLLIFSPCWIVGLLVWMMGGMRAGPMRFECVRMPTADNPVFWRTRRYWAFPGGRGGGREFFRRFLPGLFSVVKGELSLVGVPPRTRSEVAAMPEDWRRLYLRGRCGLIVEPGVIYDVRRSADDAFAADVCFVARPSFMHEVVLVCRYFLGQCAVARTEKKGGRA